MKTNLPKKYESSYRGSTCSVVIQASGSTLLSLETASEAFMTQLSIPGIQNFIAIFPKQTEWRMRIQKVPSHLLNGTGLKHVLTLHPGRKSAFIAFCLGAISRDTAKELLNAFPTVFAVACNQGLFARTQLVRARPPETPAP
jgi:hypothetical protein